MGWKTTRTNREMLGAMDIWQAVPDELLGSCVYYSLVLGGGLLIGQNKAKTAISVKLFEPNESSPPQYANTDAEILTVLGDLQEYLAKHPEVLKHRKLLDAAKSK